MATKTAVRCIGTRKKDGLRCTRVTTNASAKCGFCTGVPWQGLTPNDAVQELVAQAAAAEVDDIGSVDDPPAPSDDEPVTPITAEIPVGEACGEPFLVGGADLYDSTVTIHAYQGESGDPDDVWEVLSARITPEAEEKLIDALAIGKTKMVPVDKTETITGAHPVDDDLGLYAKAEQIAKSINARMKQGESPMAIREVNQSRIDALRDALEKAQAQGVPQELLDHYNAAITQFEQRLEPSFSIPYAEGGKIPQIDKWTGTFTHSTTVYEQQLIADELEGAVLPMSQVKARRIDPWLDEDGKARWDGKRTYNSTGEMWTIDLGDGYTAHYFPTSLTEGNSVDFSARRRITITGPHGRGHAPELVSRMSRLNLVSEPMTANEAEFAYLENVAYAMGGGTYLPKVEAARQLAAKVDDIEFERLAHENFAALANGTPADAANTARQLRLRAEKAALPKKVKILRDAVADAHGFGTGDDLAASPGYDPTPQRSGGWYTWKRPDMADGTPAADQWKKRALVHYLNKGGVNGGGIIDILKNSGVLASQERRRQFGTPKHLGWSEDTDRPTGGASTTFCYIRTPGNTAGGARIVWSGEDARRLATRADWYATKGDSYGVTNKAHSHWSASTITRDPAAAAEWTASGEMMFRDGLDLVHSDAPTAIHCGTEAHRNQGIKILKERGITMIGGRPVEDVLKV